MEATHYYLTCGITDGETGEHAVVSATIMLKHDVLVMRVQRSDRPECTHTYTSSDGDAAFIRSLLAHLGIAMPAHVGPMVAD